MGSCQNYGPCLGTLNNRCRILIGTQKGTIILTTTPILLPHLLILLGHEQDRVGFVDRADCLCLFRYMGCLTETSESRGALHLQLVGPCRVLVSVGLVMLCSFRASGNLFYPVDSAKDLDWPHATSRAPWGMCRTATKRSPEWMAHAQ